jgi:hypothetical protein
MILRVGLREGDKEKRCFKKIVAAVVIVTVSKR